MKKISLTLILVLLLGLLAGCGGASHDTAAAEMAVAEPAAPAEEAMVEEATAGGTLEDISTSNGMVSGEISVNLSEKIIYTAYADIETTEFDRSIETVHALLETYQGFIESSSVTGSNLQDNYYGYSSLRNAHYTLRIPRENYAAVTDALSSVGNVIYLTNDATNITAQYTDTESRLLAYETEEERLLAILKQAETVEDMIDLESRLSEIRYEKESLTSLLTNWDNQVSYSTVTLSIQEVEILTPTPVQKLTYWQEVGQALKGTVSWMFSFGKGLLKVLIAATPLLLPLVVIGIVILVVFRRKKHRGSAKSTAPTREDSPRE